MSESIVGSPTFALAEDINFNGSLDLLVCYHDLAQNRPGIALFLNNPDEDLPFGSQVTEIPLGSALMLFQPGKSPRFPCKTSMGIMT